MKGGKTSQNHCYEHSMMVLPFCHSTILSVHNCHSYWLAHASDTFIYTPRHTRADGKVAGNISSEYMKQRHNTLDEINSHTARGIENWKDYQRHRCTHTHTKQTSHLKQTDYSQTGAGSIITTVTKHQNIIMRVNHHYIQGIQAILEA